MNFTWLKSYMPRSLFGRSLMILLFPVVFLQLVIGLVFIQRHFAQVTDQMTNSVSLEVRYAADSVEQAADITDARAILDTLSRPFNIKMTLLPNTVFVPGIRRYFYDVSGKSIVTTLKRGLRRPIFVDLTTDKTLATLAFRTSKGILHADIPRARVSAINPHQLLVLMVFVSIFLTVISILFLRNQIRPIRELAQVSEAFGKGRSIAFQPSGANEVRRAGTAFLSMRARLERQIEQRTHMLSGVSHDLRTPLTRLKLSLAMLDPSPEVEQLQDDVTEMEKMLDGFLSFARGDTLEEIRPTDIKSLFEKVRADCERSGNTLDYIYRDTGDGTGLVTLRPAAIVRAVNNLLSNAYNYADTVRLRVSITGRLLTIEVTDDGPGIRVEDHAEALKPFVRLDPARNQNRAGGVGLGLSIAADIARSHGGQLRLAVSKSLGGLRATLTIPL